jgi:hypothetical protein
MERRSLELVLMNLLAGVVFALYLSTLTKMRKKDNERLRYVRIVSTGALGSAVTGNIAEVRVSFFQILHVGHGPPQLGFVVWCFEESSLSVVVRSIHSKKN